MSHPYQPSPNQSEGQPFTQEQPAYGQPYPPQGQLAYGQPPVGHPQYGAQPQPAPRKGSGLAISALVVGIIALLLCWVPIINNFAAILAVVGLALGIPALISARRGKRTGSGLAVAGVVLSALALVGVLATQAFYGKVIDDVTDELNNSSAGLAGDAESSAAVDAESAANADADASAANADASAAAAAVLALGQPAELTDYTVTVESVTTNGNDVVAEENQFNSPPTGQYVLVGVTVTYTGADEGDPWLDLNTEFIGTDARKYDTSSCSAVIPDEVSDVPTLLTGGTASYQVCMDLPPTAIEGGQVEISESLSFDDVSAVWAIQ